MNTRIEIKYIIKMKAKVNLIQLRKLVYSKLVVWINDTSVWLFLSKFFKKNYSQPKNPHCNLKGKLSNFEISLEDLKFDGIYNEFTVGAKPDTQTNKVEWSTSTTAPAFDSPEKKFRIQNYISRALKALK